MPMQYNMGPGQPMYSPARDIAYMYPQIVQGVENRLYEGPFKPLSEYLKSQGVTEIELAEAVRVYCLFLNSAHKTPGQTVEQCLEEVGWMSQPPAARIAVMFYLGGALTGSFFQAIRDITKQGDDPAHVEALTVCGQRAARYMNAGWLRRAFLRFKAKWLTSAKSTSRQKGEK